MYYRLIHYSLLLLCTGLLIVSCNNKTNEEDKGQDGKKKKVRKRIRKDSSGIFNTRYALNDYWNTIDAEIARYNAERIVHGEKRSYTCVMILKKDSLNSKALAEKEDLTNTYRVKTMKFSRLANIRTNDSPLRFSTHMHFKQEYPEVLYRMTHSSQDWNGNIFKVFQKEASGYNYRYFSYWNNQGSGDTLLPESIWFEDQLAYTLRTLKFKNDLTFNKTVMGTQVSNRANKPELYNARITVTDYNKEEGGSIIPLWKVTVSLTPDKQNIYYLSKGYPHTLIRMTAWDGRTLKLTSTKHQKNRN